MLSENAKKANFMASTLQNYGTHAVKSQRTRIRQHTRKRTGAMLAGVNKHVMVNGKDNGGVMFTLATHQRFQDMRLSSRVYNKIFRWYYYAIAEHLQYFYKEEAIDILNGLNDK